MFFRLLRFSLRRRFLVLTLGAAAVLLGVWSAIRLPLDVLPDLSPVQVEILTSVPDLAPEESENSVTRPLEREMAGLPGLTAVRSQTRFGISQVVLIFSDGTDVYRARQFVGERLPAAVAQLPHGLSPRLAPLSTGLGEVFTYALRYRSGNTAASPAEERTRLTALKTLQDFTVRPAMRAVPGVADVNTTGGYDRELVVEPDVDKLVTNGLDLNDVADALIRNVAPGGGALRDQPETGRQQTVRSRLRAQTPEEIAGLTVKVGWGATPVLLREVAEVRPGARVRTGAATLDGEEAVVGTALMLPGENGRAVARRCAEAARRLQGRLPAGIELVPLLDRSRLVGDTVRTVQRNLLEGALLVVAVLFLFLGNVRGALIAVAVIPAGFALGLAGLGALGFSGNLMSLGAIDFGLLVDGAVVLVENTLRRLANRRDELGGREPDTRERTRVVLDACREVGPPTAFGVAIITLVYLPIFGLEGVEGKLFAPLAAAAVLALLGALALTLTAVPALLATFARAGTRRGEPRVVAALRGRYRPLLEAGMRRRGLLLGVALGVGALAVLAGSRLGGEFLPRLDEGALVVEIRRPAGGSLDNAVAAQRANEQAIRAAVPEVARMFSRIGMSDLATDPQSPDENDLYVTFQPRRKWGRGVTPASLAEAITKAMTARDTEQELTTNQPIAVRFEEMLEGVRADLAVKVFGPDPEELDRLGHAVREVVTKVPGAAEVALEEVGRVDTLEIVPDREALRRFQATAAEVDGAISTGMMGREVGRIDEGEEFYPLVVRLPEDKRRLPATVAGLPFRSAERGLMLSVGQVAQTRVVPRLGTLHHEDAQRRRAVIVNVRGRDLAGFAAEARRTVKAEVKLPAGYRVEFGGSFENYLRARARLAWLVPLTLAGVFVLVLMALRSWSLALAVYAAVPLALAGGVFALALRGMPFTIPAAVGFIALAGISTLNGLVLATAYRDRRRRGEDGPTAAVGSALERMRPVLITALVAAGGFVPMALSTQPGAEVQRPLATVVIGGIITSTLLTLLVVPAWLAALRGRGPSGAIPSRAGRRAETLTTV